MTVSAEIGAIKPKQVALNPAQFASLAVAEQCMAQLQWAAAVVEKWGSAEFARSLVAAAKDLERAHVAFVESTQRAVSIAAPGDIAKLVQP